MKLIPNQLNFNTDILRLVSALMNDQVRELGLGQTCLNKLIWQIKIGF